MTPDPVQPLAPAVEPPAPRRRWPWVMAALVVVAGLVGAALVARDVVRWAAGVGSLEWWGDAGWAPISRADAMRREWAAEHTFLTPRFREVAPGLDVADLQVRRPPNPLVTTIFLARVDPASWRFRVWGRPSFEPAPVDTLAEEAGLALAVNAAYFSAEGPLGLVVSDGSARGREGKNRAAHFLVPRGGVPRIVNQKGAPLGPLEQGFQGFPAIMSGGRTFGYMRFGGRGFPVDRVERRTAACVLRGGEVLFLVTDTLANGLTLDELATVLGGLGCVDAMGFDGGMSTGMALHVEGYERTIANVEPVPVVVGVERAR